MTSSSDTNPEDEYADDEYADHDAEDLEQPAGPGEIPDDEPEADVLDSARESRRRRKPTCSNSARKSPTTRTKTRTAAVRGLDVDADGSPERPLSVLGLQDDVETG